MSEEKVSLAGQPTPQVQQVPTELVPLPSGGKVYPVGGPLHGKTALEIRAMTARDEDILTSKALLKQGKAIGALLRSCLMDKTIDVDNMLVGDRNALVVAIRITGYGPGYTILVTCPSCDAQQEHEFNLAELAIKPLTAEPTSPGKNEFKFVLPVTKREVLFRLTTGADEGEINKIMEEVRKTGQPEAPLTTRLQHQITNLGGETDPAKIAQLVRTMSARESRDLRKHIGEISPDVNMVQKYRCSACEEETEVTVPMTVEFFWPS